jgi:hypothetical protein
MSRLTTKQRRAQRKRRRWVSLVQEGRRLWAERKGPKPTGLLGALYREPLSPDVAINVVFGHYMLAAITAPARRWFDLGAE